MHPLTERQIRSSFVNCSRGEASSLTLPPDLADLSWDRLDILGWVDRRAPLRSYVLVPMGPEPGDEVVGMALRVPETAASRRRAVCAWCEDVTATDETVLLVARRAGAAGRKGDTIGTLLCGDFACSRNVRRRPTLAEAGDDPAGVVARRVAGLRERSQKFAREVLREV